jgi:ethanolamine utilization protein EutP (predicted NTPase)
VIALSKEDLNPEMTNTVINEMTKLNTNKKFSISSFNNNGVEDLTSYLFEKCEIEDDQ